MSTVNEMKEQFEAFLAENEKHESGNGAAGTRARKALGEIAKMCKTRRAEIQEEKNARKDG